MSSGSLTPAPSTSELSSCAHDLSSIHGKLNGYKRRYPRDDTTKFLTEFFKYLPREGQKNLADDIASCDDDEKLHQLRKSLETGLLRPMKAKGGRTPTITPSPRIGLEDSIENLAALDFESAIESDRQELRKSCLKRDGNLCVVSQSWDITNADCPDGYTIGPLQAVHILPFALGSFTNEEGRLETSAIWVNIFRYFPDLRARLNMMPGDVNREDNVMMMLSPLHPYFGAFKFIFEATDTPHRYRIKTFPGFPTAFFPHLPQANAYGHRYVQLRSHDANFPVPNPSFLAVHAAIGNILRTTGRGEEIDQLLHDLEGPGSSGLARDGSTNIGDLLSVSRLSVLSEDRNRSQPSTDNAAKPTSAAPRGTENWGPRSQNT
ncbi:hypothetical protein OIDMADRAFT_177417 [Oidiodendron maius Zn]|uniref:HNH nuclease domain-containing protein n=1 Tax=Oidiodendron maius (strain Zn) TaxID=913774 RepID=A0A0C3DSR5_OIDMZ|nr:hypothetical protein OIDMADRAFT_177417 [Oidiodendron maius Zn]